MKKERKSERITSCGVDQDGKVTVQVGKKELKLFAGDLRRRPPACHRQPSQAHQAQAAKLSSRQAQFLFTAGAILIPHHRGSSIAEH